jgi:glutamate-1-semialdehyde 2,1-aminomutase
MDRTTELLDRASRVSTGGHSNLRTPVSAIPTILEKGWGARFRCVDGREYIDWMLAAGPAILGHGNREYLDALHAQLEELYYAVSGACRTTMDIELAEKFVEHVPCAEKVRFCMTGTEAVQLAIRLARAYTERSYVLRFEGHYHGSLDNVLGGLISDDPVNNPWPQEGEADPFGTRGRDPAAWQNMLRIPWNDVEVLEQVFSKWGERIAVMMMEPINCTGGCLFPRPGYLERCRELCDQYGVVFLFDEVITGWRLGLHSGQGEVGITPDLATFGKAMAAGVPISAVAGKATILDELNRGVIGAGTFNGYPLGVTAALTTIKILERDNGAIYRRVDEIEARLTMGLKEICHRHSLPVLLLSPRGMFSLYFTDQAEAWSVRDLARADRTTQDRLRVLLAEQGVLHMWGGRWYVCAAHTETDVDQTLDAFDRALDLL